MREETSDKSYKRSCIHGGAEGETFMDVIPYKKVVGFEIRSGWAVDGIAVIYVDRTKGVFHGNPKGGSNETIKIADGDEIVRIEGMKNYVYCEKKVITNLKFITQKGITYGPYGKPEGNIDGDKFIIDIPTNSEILGLCGMIDYIGDEKVDDKKIITALGFIVKQSS